MKTAFDFICFALSHAKKATLPSDALLPVPPTYVGSDGEWEYLYGTTGWTITQKLLNDRYKNYYYKSYTSQKYAELTQGFIGRVACDCQGLLDYFLGVDVNAHANYVNWCTEKKPIFNPAERLEIGTAVFKQGETGKMTHVGFICGYLPDGDMLVVEERGIKYGCVITKLSEREFTHSGKPTAKLDYSEPISIWVPQAEEPVRFELTTPRHQGEAYRFMQIAINAVGIPDATGNSLVVDGVWGVNSQFAFDALIKQYAPKVKVDLVINDASVFDTEV